MWRSLAVAAGLSALSARGGAAQTQYPDTAWLAREIPQLLRVSGVPGLSLAVVRGGRVVEERDELVLAQDAGQPTVAPWRGQVAGRVDRDATGAGGPGEVPAEGRGLPRDGPLGVATGGEVGDVAAQERAVDGLGAGDLEVDPAAVETSR